MSKGQPTSAAELLAQLKDNYASELANKIDEIEQHVLKLTRTNQFQETVRKVHSMKGTAGTFGFLPVSTICHHMEDELALLNPAGISPANIDKLLEYIDLLRRATRALVNESEKDFDVDRLLSRLHQHRGELSVLLVDGTKSIPALIRDAFKQRNVDLKCSEDGYLALGMLLMKNFDLLITSEEVGRLNGQALISALKASNSPSHTTPTVLLSSRKVNRTEIGFKPDYILQKDASLTTRLGEIIKSLSKR